MSQFTRASLSELQDFANKVREAGGGEAIHALIPSVPQDPSQCLIARNLNFSSEVAPYYPPTSTVKRWAMWVKDEETRDKIAESLGLDKTERGGISSTFGVVLPGPIGQVAQDFDTTLNDIDYLTSWQFDYEVYNKDTNSYVLEIPADFDVEGAIKRNIDDLDDKARARLAEFLPYIELSNDISRQAATLVTESGKVVL